MTHLQIVQSLFAHDFDNLFNADQPINGLRVVRIGDLSDEEYTGTVLAKHDHRGVTKLEKAI